MQMHSPVEINFDLGSKTLFIRQSDHLAESKRIVSNSQPFCICAYKIILLQLARHQMGRFTA
jgi:hypothetical protein